MLIPKTLNAEKKMYTYADNIWAVSYDNVSLGICGNWRPRSACASTASLRKHAYSNILKIFQPKNENFQIKISDTFYISAQNIHCGYSLEPPQWGSSNKYPQSMFLSRNKKNNVYPCKPQFYYIKAGFKGVKTIQACFRDVIRALLSANRITGYYWMFQ